MAKGQKTTSLWFLDGTTLKPVDSSWSISGSGDVTGPASSTNNAIVRFDETTGKIIQDSSVVISDNGEVQLIDGTNSLPAISFISDPNTGFYNVSSDVIGVSTGGTKRFSFSGGGIFSRQTKGFSIQEEAASATNPIYTFVDDLDTGVGAAALDQLSLIAGGVEGIRITETAGAMTTDITDRVNVGGTGLSATHPAAIHAMDTTWQLLTADNATDTTNKDMRWGAYHYTNAEEPFLAFMASTKVGTNLLLIGGGSGAGNASTSITMYCAADNTTVSGTEVMGITLGAVDITGTLAVSSVLTASSTVELGHATDTTLARVSAGVVSIEGNNIITANIASSVTVAGVVELATTAEIEVINMIEDSCVCVNNG